MASSNLPVSDAFTKEYSSVLNLRGSMNDNTLQNVNGDIKNMEQTQHRRRLEEVQYWRKRAGWYDDAITADDDYVPSSSANNDVSSAEDTNFSTHYSLASTIIGAVVLFGLMIVFAKMLAKAGTSKTSSGSEDRKREGRSKEASSPRSRSRSKSRSRREKLTSGSSSRARSRSKSRSRRSSSVTARSRSRSRRSTKVTDEYNLMEESRSPRNKVLV